MQSNDLKPKIDWILIIVVILAFLFVCGRSKAEGGSPIAYNQPGTVYNNSIGPFDPNAFARHFTAAYALTTVSYLFTTEVLHWDPLPAFLFSALLTTMAGVVFEGSEATQPNNTNDRFGQAMLYNSAGIAGAGLTIAIIKF